MPTCFSDKPTLTGGLVTLRPVEPADVEVLAAIINGDEEVARLTGSIHSSHEQGPGWSLAELREIYGRWSVADDRLVLAVVDRATDRVVGEVVLKDLDEANRSCDYRTLIGAEGRGRGPGRRPIIFPEPSRHPMQITPPRNSSGNGSGRPQILLAPA